MCLAVGAPQELIPGTSVRAEPGRWESWGARLQPFHLISIQIHCTADTGNRYPKTQTKIHTDL